jgi:hypothetical protein
MEYSPYWDADSRTPSEEIPCLSLNPKVHYYVHKRPPMDPILSHMNSVHSSHPTSLRSILILYFRLCLCLPDGILPSDSLINIFRCLGPSKESVKTRGTVQHLKTRHFSLRWEAVRSRSTPQIYQRFNTEYEKYLEGPVHPTTLSDWNLDHYKTGWSN